MHIHQRLNRREGSEKEGIRKYYHVFQFFPKEYDCHYSVLLQFLKCRHFSLAANKKTLLLRWKYFTRLKFWMIRDKSEQKIALHNHFSAFILFLWQIDSLSTISVAYFTSFLSSRSAWIIQTVADAETRFKVRI